MDGQTITYDGAGNPLSYYDGYRYTLTWSEGRRLASLTYANKTTRYEYNADGIRTKKFNADGTYVVYHLADGRAIGETTYASNGTAVQYMRYAFDESDSVIGFSLWSGGWQHYYFVKNLQGDVIRVYKAANNTLVASYTYDSWGNVLSATGELATINPFRYRGYYYDNESWFYYLNSRYYDPAIGRFINADVFTSTGQGFIGYNMFAYCNNNPVKLIDYSGKIGVVFWTGLAVSLISGIANAVSTAINGGSVEECLVAGVIGFAAGAAGYSAAVYLSGGTLLMDSAIEISQGAGLTGRAISSLICDVGTELMDDGNVSGTDCVEIGMDLMYDTVLSCEYYYYNPYPSSSRYYANAAFCAVLDGTVDVSETVLFNKRLRTTPSNKSTSGYASCGR